MNPEIKAQWVAALRSGEYKQGRGQLRNTDDEYCCLGVLCDLAVKAGVTEWVFSLESTSYGCGAYEATVVPPPEVRKWDEHPGLSYRFSGKSLIVQNDFAGKSFLEIADLIEAEL